jgi:tRNA threonylcarbamoyladenosine biosynthesis protein TsaB
MTLTVLALDTTLAACGVAVLRGDAVLVRRQAVLGRGQAEALLPMVRDAMAEAALPFAAVQLVAVTVGPGTFTGIRSGLAAARGLALAIGCPCAGVTTTAALAAAVPDRPLLVAVDALKDEVYWHLFDDRAGPELAAPEAVAAHLPVGIAALGSGAPLVQAAGAVLTILAAAPDPDPVLVGRLGLAAHLAGRALPPSPLYIRRPDAKPMAVPPDAL